MGRLNRTSLILLAFAISFLYQNCTPMGFSKISLYSTETQAFAPNTKLENGRPINVIVFLDTSNSMSGIKESFKQNLSNFLDTLKDANINLGIYDLNNHLSSTKTYDAILDASTTVSLTYNEVTSLPGGSLFFENYFFKFDYGYKFNPTSASSSISSAQFSFESLMDESARTSTLNALKTKIDKMFDQGLLTMNVSDAGLCGILRILDDIANKKSPFLVDQKTPTVIMLLSNEDDESKLINLDWIEKTYLSGLGSNICAKSIKQKRQKVPDRIINFMDAYYYKVGVTAEFTVDGGIVSDSFTMYATGSPPDYIPFTDQLTVGQDCLSLISPTIPYVMNRLKNHNSFLGWTYSGNLNIQSCTIEKNSNLWVKSSNFIQTKALTNNLYFTTVINPTDGQCPSTDGSHLGVKYENLAKSFGIKGDIIPICNSNYGEKIQQVAQKIITASTGVVEIPEDILSNMNSFDVKRGDQILHPEATDYELKIDRIVFRSGYLQATDIVQIHTKEQVN